MNERLIAIIADSSTGDERDPAVQQLALAAVTAILEHGGRVLLSADAAVRLPVLLAASEYVSPAQVETAEGRAPAPVILAPFPGDQSIEERHFTQRDRSEDDEEGASRTLLSELVHAGIVHEPEHGERDPSPRAFEDLLRTLRPAAVLAIGRSERADALHRAAVRYHHHEERSRLLRLDRSSLNDWPGIDDRTERFRIAPRFEGQPLEDRGVADDGLWRIAMHAAGDAARVLAIEDAIAEILDDLDSIAPAEPVRG